MTVHLSHSTFFTISLEKSEIASYSINIYHDTSFQRFVEGPQLIGLYKTLIQFRICMLWRHNPLIPFTYKNNRFKTVFKLRVPLWLHWPFNLTYFLLRIVDFAAVYMLSCCTLSALYNSGRNIEFSSFSLDITVHSNSGRESFRSKCFLASRLSNFNERRKI